MARVDKKLHDFCHEIRNTSARVLGSGHDSTGPTRLFESFNNEAAQLVADFYRANLRDESVACTIRIATENEEGQKTYVTYGRSGGLNPNRGQQTVPIPADKGLPARLRNVDYQGVLIIPSICDAIATGEYLKTPNDDLGDCKSVMVCPINGWEAGQRVTLGTLSVTAAGLNAFSRWHVPSFCALADTLGLVYPLLLGRLDAARRPPTTAQITPTKKKRQKDR